MNNGTAVRCLFCGRSAPEVKMTNEHVLRHWFKQHFVAPSESGAHRVSGWRLLDDNETVVRTDRDLPVSPWDVTVREVCSECNNEILNKQIEWPAQDVLLALMQGAPAVVDPSGMRLVATWAAKTTVTLGSNLRSSAVPFAHAEHIASALEPPPLTRVLIGCAPETDHVMFVRHVPFDIEPVDDEINSCHVTTIYIGALVLVVTGAEFGYGDELIRRVAADDPSWAVHLREIWPTSPDRLDWPMRSSIPDFESLDALSMSVPQRLGVGEPE